MCEDQELPEKSQGDHHHDHALKKEIGFDNSNIRHAQDIRKKHWRLFTSSSRATWTLARAEHAPQATAAGESGIGT